MKKVVLHLLIISVLFSCRNSLLIPEFEEGQPLLNGKLLNTAATDFISLSLNGGYKTFGLEMAKIVSEDTEFYVAKTEVTQSFWEAALPGVSYPWSELYGKGSDYPANLITYSECEQLVSELNYRVNRGDISNFPNGFYFAIPTKEEWQLAAAGGSGYLYAGSSDVDKVAVYNSFGSKKPLLVGTAREKKLTPNGFGLYDMSGNVAEWCSDDLGDDTAYALGGHFNSPAVNCQIDTLKTFAREGRSAYLGLRLVLRKGDLPVSAIESIAFENSRIETKVNDNIRAKVNVFPANSRMKNLIFTTDNPEILEISQNPRYPYHVNLAAKASGKANLTVTVEGTDISNQCEVVISDYRLSSSKKVLSLSTASDKSFNVSLSSYSGRDINASDVTWSVENGEIASIETLSHLTCKVTGLKTGTTNVVVSIKSNGIVFEYKTEIVVTTGITDLDIISDNYDEKTQSLRFDINSYPTQLKAKIYPENAVNPGLIWSSADTSIVSVDAYGVLYTYGRIGSTTIRLASKENPDVYVEYPVDVTVHVKGITSNINSKQILRTETAKSVDVDVSFFPPDATNKKLIWSVGDEGVAKIEGSGSSVTVVAVGDAASCPTGKGTTTVKVASEDGNFTVEFDVDVYVQVNDLVIRDAAGNVIGDEGLVFHTGVETTMPAGTTFSVEPLPAHYYRSNKDEVGFVSSHALLRRTDSRSDARKLELSVQSAARISPCSDGVHKNTILLSFSDYNEEVPISVYVDLISISLDVVEGSELKYVPGNTIANVSNRFDVTVTPYPYYASIKTAEVISSSEDGSQLVGEAVFTGEGEARRVAYVSVCASKYANNSEANVAYAYLHINATGVSGNEVTTQTKYPFVIRQTFMGLVMPGLEEYANYDTPKVLNIYDNPTDFCDVQTVPPNMKNTNLTVEANVVTREGSELVIGETYYGFSSLNNQITALSTYASGTKIMVKWYSAKDPEIYTYAIFEIDTRAIPQAMSINASHNFTSGSLDGKNVSIIVDKNKPVSGIVWTLDDTSVLKFKHTSEKTYVGSSCTLQPVNYGVYGTVTLSAHHPDFPDVPISPVTINVSGSEPSLEPGDDDKLYIVGKGNWSGGYEVSSYAYEFPSVYNGKTVYGIRSGAYFSDEEDEGSYVDEAILYVKEIILGPDISVVEAGAFNKCNNLQFITVRGGADRPPLVIGNPSFNPDDENKMKYAFLADSEEGYDLENKSEPVKLVISFPDMTAAEAQTFVDTKLTCTNEYILSTEGM